MKVNNLILPPNHQDMVSFCLTNQTEPNPSLVFSSGTLSTATRVHTH